MHFSPQLNLVNPGLSSTSPLTKIAVINSLLYFTHLSTTSLTTTVTSNSQPMKLDQGRLKFSTNAEVTTTTTTTTTTQAGRSQRFICFLLIFRSNQHGCVP